MFLGIVLYVWLVELTKKHEEFIRGRISEIIEIVDDLKGEMVIVMEGSKENGDSAGNLPAAL